MTPFDVCVIPAVSVPVALMLCHIAKIKETINAMVVWRKDNTKISPGFLIETLVVCFLCSRKPLWKVEIFWEQQDLSLLFPQTDLSAQQLNDDAYGAALDKLSDIKMETLISAVSLTLLAAHQLSISSIRLDTTSVSYQGECAGEPHGDFDVVHGFSKDNHPELKQFKIGTAVQQQGLPVMGELLAGNKADAEWNPETVLKMQTFFAEKGFSDILFVGDSATVSSYDRIDSLSGTRFISRFPERFSLANEVKVMAWQQNQWQELGRLKNPNDKESSYYKTASFQQTLKGKEFRFVAIHSSALEAQKRHTLEKQVAQKKSKWETEANKLSKQLFDDEKSAQQFMEKFNKQVQESNFSIESKLLPEIVESYTHKGRPKKGEQPVSTTKHRISWTIGTMDSKEFERILHIESTFILITTLLDTIQYPDRFILGEYKEQISVENAFRFLKNPAYLGPVYVEKKNRIEAIGYIFILVLLLACYLEYRVRESLKTTNEAVQLPGNKHTQRPSTMTILEVLDKITVVKVGDNRYFPKNIDLQALNMIRWAGFDPDIYLMPWA